MLQKNCVVKARKAIEAMYDGLCTIIESQKIQRADKTIGFQDVIVQKDIPCRLSFSRIDNVHHTETGAEIS